METAPRKRLLEPPPRPGRVGLRRVIALLAWMLVSTAEASYVVTDPITPGATQCGFYVDASPRVTVPVTPVYSGNICMLDISALGAGTHTITATAISVNDPFWGSQESPPSLPLVLTTSSTTVVEYYDAALDHYFMTSVTSEIQALDAGAFGGAWKRTGQSFNAWATAADASISAVPVCRIFISYAGGSSHFYSGLPAECAAASSAPGSSLLLESPSVMYILLATDSGACAYGTQPIYRVWSNRADSNHRFVTDINVRSQMIGKGWMLEGPGPGFAVMCAPIQQ
jgi:hypothetical protein